MNPFHRHRLCGAGEGVPSWGLQAGKGWERLAKPEVFLPGLSSRPLGAGQAVGDNLACLTIF